MPNVNALSYTVFVGMYYIPGAQKNVYLKEISTLVKAIRKSGGIEPIAHAADLNEVRNLLFDWVSEGLGHAGPEAVARMIKLEVRQAQAEAPMPVAGPTTLPAMAQKPGMQAVPLSILVTPVGVMILAQDVGFMAAMEKEAGLAERLVGGGPIVGAGMQVFVMRSTLYDGGKMLYECVGLRGG